MRSAAKILILLFTFTWYGCEEAFVDKSYPYVVGVEPSVNATGVTLKADVLDAGNVPVLEYGFIIRMGVLPLTPIEIRNRKFTEGEYSFRLQSSLVAGVTYYVRPYATTSTYTVYGNEFSFESKGSLAPVITSFTPAEGPIGTSVVITGENMGYIPELVVLKFGTTVAVVDSVFEDKLYTHVPVITAPEVVKISIETAAKTATSTSDFDMWFPWKRLADFPGTFVYSPASFTAAGKIYVLGGQNISVYNEFWEYNPSTNVWTSLTPFPGQPRYQAIAFTVNNKGYYGLGRDATNFFKDFWEYDPATGMWKQLKDYPGVTTRTQRSFSAQNKGYVGLGLTTPGQVYTLDVWEYNPALDSWNRVADFPAIASGRIPGLSLSDSQVGYLGMGSTSADIFKDIYKYSPTDNMWTLVTTYPGNGYRDMGSFLIAGKIYVGAGSNVGNTTYQDFREYDPVGNTWKSMRSLPIKFAPYVTATIGSKGYFGVGWYDHNAVNDPLFGKYFYEFDPTKN